MAFDGPGRPLTADGFTRICDTIECDAPTLWAVLSVETAGFGFLPDRRPRILFERHIFHKRTGGRFSAAHPDISNARRGGYASGAAEYPRLERALALDAAAALQSASWGVGQVMGFNHAPAGFATVHAMVDAMIESEDAQLMATASFICASNLARTLRTRNWAGFAKGYNGPAYAVNKYDTKLAAFHARYTDSSPDLRMRAAQAALLYIGLNPGPVDGLPGRRTRAAIKEFQVSQQRPRTGDLDPTTEALLIDAAFPGAIV